ncbi:hypothetical protein BCH_03228 [Brucella sp. 191011898]|nr:hypothetical protein BCH_03228 [Brucella sp. 191011898]
MMGTTASFHRNNTWRQFGSKTDNSITPQPLSNNNHSAFVQPNKAAAILAQINTKDHYLHGSLLPLLNTGIIHWCRREGRAIHKGGPMPKQSVARAAADRQKSMLLSIVAVVQSRCE